MITIVTDSSSYFKEKEALEAGIKLVPINYSVHSQQYSELFSDQNGDFESLLKSGPRSSTAQPSIGAFLSCFERELAVGNEVLCIVISSRMSGTYRSACLAAERAANKGVAVFDSHSTAGGLYLLVKAAAKLVDQNLSLSEIVERLPAIRDRITVTFSVDSMLPLRKSGRIGFVRMGVSTILNIKPVLLCKDGAVEFDSIARGNTDVIKNLIGKISPDAQEIVINYIGSDQLATDLYNMAKQSFPQAALTFQKMGPVLAIHLGQQVIAVSFIRS